MSKAKRRFVKVADNNQIEVWQDRETGVQYMIAFTSTGTGVTPLLHADGTLYTGPPLPPDS